MNTIIIKYNKIETTILNHKTTIITKGKIHSKVTTITQRIKIIMTGIIKHIKMIKIKTTREVDNPKNNNNIKKEILFILMTITCKYIKFEL